MRRARPQLLATSRRETGDSPSPPEKCTGHSARRGDTLPPFRRLLTCNFRARAQVRHKLAGYDGTAVAVRSVAGQVQQLIQDATDINLLSRMYHGWAALC